MEQARTSKPTISQASAAAEEAGGGGGGGLSPLLPGPALWTPPSREDATRAGDAPAAATRCARTRNRRWLLM